MGYCKLSYDKLTKLTPFERDCEIHARDARIAELEALLIEQGNTTQDYAKACQRAERERDTLKAQVGELEAALNFPYHMTPTGGTFGTSVMEQIEEEVEDNARLYRLTRELREERDELRRAHDEQVDKVLELAAECDELRAECEAWSKTNFEIHAQLAEANEKLAHMTLNRDYLSNEVREWKADYEKLAAQKPAEPTIVKQTWQPVYPYLVDGPFPPQPSKVGALSWGPEALGVIRCDHYSDGTVRAILEPIEQGEKR